MFGCCCQAQDPNEANATVDSRPVVLGHDENEDGLENFETDKGKKEDLPRAPPQIEEAPKESRESCVINLSIRGVEDLGMIFDSSGLEAVHIATQPAEESTFGKAIEAQPEAQRVRRGDYIVRINHISGDASRMITEAITKTVLEIEICRSHNFDISVDKSGHPLGCVINYDMDTGTSLLIEEIKTGAVSVWNEANPGQMVKVQDRIIAVDGKGGTGVELLGMVKNATGVIALTMSRPQEVTA